MVVITACVLLAWLAWALPLNQIGKKSSLALELTVDSLTLELIKPLEWQGNLLLHEDPVRLEEMSHLSLPVADYKQKTFKERAWLQIEGGELSLTKLSLDDIRERGEMDIASESGGTTSIFVKNLKLSGEFELTSAQRVLAGSHAEQQEYGPLTDLSPPETLTFAATANAIPAWLQISLRDELVFNHVPVRGLSFTREVSPAPAETDFVSTIIEGNLRLLDISKQVILRQGESLKLAGIEGRLHQIHIGEQIRISFEGSAESIRKGLALEQDLTPSILEYLYSSKSLTLLWGSVGLLWGILWGVRRILVS
jgi:hypothetical protein